MIASRAGACEQSSQLRLGVVSEAEDQEERDEKDQGRDQFAE